MAYGPSHGLLSLILTTETWFEHQVDRPGTVVFLVRFDSELDQ